MAKAIKKILLVRNDRFGEFLLNIPAMRALKETFREAQLTAVVSPDVEELAKCVPFIDRVMVFGSRKRGIYDLFALAGRLRKEKFDIALISNPSKEFNIVTALAGIPERIGYSRKWGFLLTKKRPDMKYLAVKHEVEYNLDLVSLAGAATENKTLSLSLPDGIIDVLLREFPALASDKLVAVHPFTSDPVKAWGWKNFLELIRRLGAQAGVRVVIIGSQNNRTIRLKGLVPGAIDLIGRTSLPQLAALLAKCRLLVSCDSGPVHLGCCVGTPVIALFRNDLPGKTARRWGPWGKNCVVIEKPDLTAIGPDEVIRRVKEKL